MELAIVTPIVMDSRIAITRGFNAIIRYLFMVYVHGLSMFFLSYNTAGAIESEICMQKPATLS